MVSYMTFMFSTFAGMACGMVVMYVWMKYGK